MFLSLGEIMLRFCPGDLPLRATDSFTFSEGGGEYNVARALSRCFGHHAGIATAIVDNEIGHLVHQLLRSSGVDDSLILWRSFDGIGRESRNPLYFAERGFGHRSPKACMDRGHSAPSQLDVEDFDWDTIFSSGKITWLHTGGIFAGLSESTGRLAHAAMSAARRHGVHVSYDPNFRGSLWQSRGGVNSAATLNRSLVPLCDTLFGIEPLLHACAPPTDPEALATAMHAVSKEYPNISSIACARRITHSASEHDYHATTWHHGEISQIEGFNRIHVLDRIGSGDSFAAGFIHGQILGKSAGDSARIGCAAAALCMSTPGDALLCSRHDVEALAKNSGPKEIR